MNTELHYGGEKIVIKEEQPEDVLHSLADNNQGTVVKLDGTHKPVWFLTGMGFPVFATQLSPQQLHIY